MFGRHNEQDDMYEMGKAVAHRSLKRDMAAMNALLGDEPEEDNNIDLNSINVAETVSVPRNRGGKQEKHDDNDFDDSSMMSEMHSDSDNPFDMGDAVDENGVPIPPPIIDEFED